MSNRELITNLRGFMYDSHLTAAQQVFVQKSIDALEAFEWQPIETADKKREILVKQDGEIYHARWSDNHNAWTWRTHNSYDEGRTYQIMDVEIDGETEARHVLINEGEETFKHHWTLYTRTFGRLEPTEWMHLSPPVGE